MQRFIKNLRAIRFLLVQQTSHLMELRKGLFKEKAKLSYGILFDNLE